VDRATKEAERAMFAYGSILTPQVDWLVERVVSISPDAREIVQLNEAQQRYQMMTVLVMVLPEHDKWTDAEFDKAWEKDRELPKRADCPGQGPNGPPTPSQEQLAAQEKA
jgi:hypothetical protein